MTELKRISDEKIANILDSIEEAYTFRNDSQMNISTVIDFRPVLDAQMDADLKAHQEIVQEMIKELNRSFKLCRVAEEDYRLIIRADIWQAFKDEYGVK